MNIKDLDKMINNLSSNLISELEDTECSIVITGSVPRNDFLVDENDEMLGDIDIIVLIKDEKDIESIHSRIYSIFKRNKEVYNSKYSLIYTLESYFLKNKNTYYVKSTNKKFILFDGLNLCDKLSWQEDKDIDKNDVIINTFQVAAYYQAKYLYQGDDRSVDKANRALVRILLLHNNIIQESTCNNPLYEYRNILEEKYELNLDDIYKYKNPGKFGVDKKLSSIVEEDVLNKYNILPSTKFFYKNKNKLSGNELFQEMSERVFLENQGIEKSKSYFDV